MNKCVLAVVLLCAGIQKEEIGAASVAVKDLETTLSALHQTFIEEFQEEDVEGISALFTPDAILMLKGYQTCNGVASVKEYYTQRFTGGPPSDSTITFESTDLIGPIGEVYAFEEGIVSATSKDNEPLFTLRVAILWFKNAEGIWKRHRFVTNAAN